MDYNDIWHMPVSARKWWINRTTKQMKIENEAAEKAAKVARRQK